MMAPPVEESWLDCGAAMFLPFLPRHTTVLRVACGPMDAPALVDLARPMEHPELWHRDLRLPTATRHSRALAFPEATGPRVLALLPSMTRDLSGGDLRALGASMTDQDVLLLALGNRLPDRWLRRILPAEAWRVQAAENHRALPFAAAAVLARAWRSGLNGSLYVCIDRLGGGRRRLVAARWRAQRHFARTGTHHSGRWAGHLWRMAGRLGLLPLLQPELLLVLRRC